MGTLTLVAICLTVAVYGANLLIFEEAVSASCDGDAGFFGLDLGCVFDFITLDGLAQEVSGTVRVLLLLVLGVMWTIIIVSTPVGGAP